MIRELLSYPTTLPWSAVTCELCGTRVAAGDLVVIWSESTANSDPWICLLCALEGVEYGFYEIEFDPYKHEHDYNCDRVLS